MEQSTIIRDHSRYISSPFPSFRLSLVRRLIAGYRSVLYDLRRFEIANKFGIVWGKMVAVQAALEEYPQTEWIWWLDADAIIMTPSIDLYEHILSPSALQNYTLTNHTIKPNERVPVIPTDETTSTSSVPPSPLPLLR